MTLPYENCPSDNIKLTLRHNILLKDYLLSNTIFLMTFMISLWYLSCLFHTLTLVIMYHVLCKIYLSLQLLFYVMFFLSEIKFLYLVSIYMFIHIYPVSIYLNPDMFWNRSIFRTLTNIYDEAFYSEPFVTYSIFRLLKYSKPYPKVYSE